MSKRLTIFAITGILVGATAPASATETIAYTYDAQGRLTQASHSGSVNSGAAAAYTLDNADNRTLVTTTGPSSFAARKAAVRRTVRATPKR